MTWLTILGLLIFLIACVVYRAIIIAALAQLDDAAKLRVIGTIPKRNLRMSIILVITVIAFVTAMFVFPRIWFYSLIGFFSLLLLFLVSLFTLNYKKLRNLSVSPDYLKNFVKAAILVIAATAILIALTLYPMLHGFSLIRIF
jgi:hypothetical protein